MISFLLDTFKTYSSKEAIIWQNQSYTYGNLLDLFESWRLKLSKNNIKANDVVMLEADFSPNALTLLLALIEQRAIIAPLSLMLSNKKDEFASIAHIERIISINENDVVTFTDTGLTATHDLLLTLKKINHPGLILFSSGSTGKSKAALHDLMPLLEKYKQQRKVMRTIAFLLFDHIGGINTMFYCISNACALITVTNRSPDFICRTIQDHRVELLPTSPTFINLLILSEAWKRFDLSSLKLITYGTEVMPASTLQRLHSILPGVKLLQTYGLSEIGILSSQSRSPDSLWVKIGGAGISYRIEDQILQIKSPSAMLGYLNAPSPFTSDGWFDTGDQVEVDGEYIKILGRKSEIINVGGEKVWPFEIEAALLEMDGVEDAAVTGVHSHITGQIVQAMVKLYTEEELPHFRKRMKHFLKDRLPAYKIPQKVILSKDVFHGGRFKKIRKTQS